MGFYVLNYFLFLIWHINCKIISIKYNENKIINIIDSMYEFSIKTSSTE